MAKYRKKPIVVEAEQWMPEKMTAPQSHCPDVLGVIWQYDHRGEPYNGIIDTLEGEHIVSPGDWIIIGVKGEKYPCKPDIFERTYELVKD